MCGLQYCVNAVLMLGRRVDGGQIKPRIQRPAVSPKRSAWNKGHLVGPKRPFCHSRCGQFVFASNLLEIYATLPFSMLQTIAIPSFTASMRNLRDASNLPDIKSNDQRWPGRRATGIGVGDPRVRLRPLRRLTPSFLLFDYPNNLGFAKTTQSHLCAPSKGEKTLH